MGRRRRRVVRVPKKRLPKFFSCPKCGKATVRVEIFRDADRAVAYCGKQSGRATDKFAATSMTPFPSRYVTPPSIQECPVNIECRIYHKQHPPHQILTPDHRKAPISEQHTIYFAEVLGVSKS